MFFNDRRKKKPTAPTVTKKFTGPTREERMESDRAANTRFWIEHNKRQNQAMDEKAKAKKLSEQRASEASRVRTFDEPERAHWARGTRRYSTPGRFEFNE